jgi:hypothetical protein
MAKRPKAVSDHLAVLILEAPWGLYDTDINRSSVRPFFEGLAAESDHIEVHYANFYDLHSFELAFEHLTKVKYTNVIVYIAAHGYEDEIEGAKVADLLSVVKVKAKTFNISGVLLGSCYVGENETSLSEAVQGSGLTWCIGYRSSVDWFAGTLVDLALIRKLLYLFESEEDVGLLSDEAQIIEMFKAGLKLFSPSFEIGCHYHKKRKIALRDSLCVVLQAKGSGKRPWIYENLWDESA